ncbi:glycoside hydrolase family 75 protein [Streptomyces sp. HNM0663]|uniref:Glycoside hydrolase family 75 protein n=1 Tax=Streptomyces chengmaiensis TaxID=3040919 RepID=A0ABT6HVI1_9ACTN|nr:glycoside hydrolase family 75 protein [Streptomyces chengmaiensis]MDH2392049.1 glycoside hydrolase family 75 protein [Streptomyces chengmaiensis]
MHTRRFALALAGGAVLTAVAAMPAAAVPAVAPPEPGPWSYRTADLTDDSWAKDAEGGVAGPAEARALLGKVERCRQISEGRYRTDPGARADVPVCGTDRVVFWKADMDIDCDGVRTAECNSRTDPWFHPTTAFRQSDGRQLNAETLPFIVVPAPSRIWDYRAHGVRGGSVAAVVYGDRVRYAVVGDTGPTTVIGEASYATAKALGINPDPRKGGVPSGVTYIVFKDTRVSPIEDHAEAARVGEAVAREFLADE